MYRETTEATRREVNLSMRVPRSGKIELPTARPLCPDATMTLSAHRPRMRDIEPRTMAETRSDQELAGAIASRREEVDHVEEMRLSVEETESDTLEAQE